MWKEHDADVRDLEELHIEFRKSMRISYRQCAAGRHNTARRVRTRMRHARVKSLRTTGMLICCKSIRARAPRVEARSAPCN